MKRRVLGSLQKVLKKGPPVSPKNALPSMGASFSSTAQKIPGPATDLTQDAFIGKMLDVDTVAESAMRFTLPELLSISIDVEGEVERREAFQSFMQRSFTRNYSEALKEVLLNEKEVTSQEGKLYVQHIKKNAWKYVVEGEAIPSSILTSSLSKYVTYPNMKYGHNGDFVRTAYHRTLNDLGHAIQRGDFPALTLNDLEVELDDNMSNLLDNIAMSNIVSEVREATRLFAWTRMPEPMVDGLKARNAKTYLGRAEGADKDFLINKNLKKVLVEERIEEKYTSKKFKGMEEEVQVKIRKDISADIDKEMKEGREYTDAQLGKALERVYGRGLTSTSGKYDADYGVRPIEKRDTAIVVVPEEKPAEKQHQTSKDDLREHLLASDLGDHVVDKKSDRKLKDEPEHTSKPGH